MKIEQRRSDRDVLQDFMVPLTHDGERPLQAENERLRRMWNDYPHAKVVLTELEDEIDRLESELANRTLILQARVTLLEGLLGEARETLFRRSIAAPLFRRIDAALSRSDADMIATYKHSPGGPESDPPTFSRSGAD